MCYLDIIDMIAERELNWEYVHNIIADAMEALRRSDRSTYEQTIKRLEDYAFKISIDEAQEIVRKMKPYGEVYSFPTIEAYLRDKGITDNLINWYLVMNMLYNDYYSAVKDYGIGDNTDFYYNMSRAFIEDEDAKPHKVERYFL